MATQSLFPKEILTLSLNLLVILYYLTALLYYLLIQVHKVFRQFIIGPLLCIKKLRKLGNFYSDTKLAWSTKSMM